MELGAEQVEEGEVQQGSNDDNGGEEPHEEGDQGVGLLLLREHADHRLDDLMPGLDVGSCIKRFRLKEVMNKFTVSRVSHKITQSENNVIFQ